MVEERAHTASTAALAEATERLTSLAATPPLPDHAVWAERAAELERSALVAFDGRALAGAAAAAARHTLAESVRREASQQLGALLRVSRQVCEDAAVLAGAGAMAEPAAAAAEGYAPAEMVGGLVQAYEDEAQGPARYDGLRSLLTSQLAPWLAQVAAAQAAARDQVAAAARAEHEREREARRDAELALATASGEVATKAEGIARLEAGALAMTQRADEQAAQLQQLTVARLEAQAESAAQLATAQQQLAAAKAEAQLSSSQGELQLERARSAAEAAGLSQAAAMAKLEQEHEKAGAAAAARLQAAEDAQLQTQAVMSTFRAEALEAREAQGQLECSLATARTEAREATAARTAAEAAEACARGDAVVGAVEEYVTALEVAEERGRKRGASQEELDSLRLQLAELHERLALLPDFYVQQVFGAEAKPGSLIDALLPDRDGEAPQRNESVALLVPPQLAASAAWEDLGCGHALRRSASAAQASVVACTWYLRPHVRANATILASSSIQDFRLLSDERAEQLRAKAGQVSEDFAASQVGNIAAAGAMLAPRIGSLAKSSWTWFSKGFAAEDEDASQAADNQAVAETPAAAAPTAAAPVAAAVSSAAAPAAAGAPAAAPAAAAPTDAATAMATQQARMQRMADKAAEARVNAG